MSLALAGKHGMLFLSPAGKNVRNNPTKANQWSKVAAIATQHGKATPRDNWRIASCVYLADRKEEAWRDVEANIVHDMVYSAWCCTSLKRKE